MASWQLQDAKARFTKFLNTALKKGSQIVTRRGVETAVLVPIQDWRRLEQAARPTLKSLLLGPSPCFQNLAPKRGALRRRKVVEFQWFIIVLGHRCRFRTPQAKAARRSRSLAAKSSRRSDLYLRRHNGETPARYRAHSKAERGQGARNQSLARPNGSFTQPALNGCSLLSRMGRA